MKKVFPHIFVLLTFCLTMSFAIWQIQRLQWKDELVEKLKVRIEMPAISAAQFENIENDEFRLLSENGKFDSANETQLLHQSFNGKVGTHVITPFVTDSGVVILINRGWVPYEQKHDFATDNHVYGVVRKNPRKGHFALVNEPDKNIWYNIELSEMYAKIGAPDITYYVEAQAEDKKSEKVYPVPLPKEINIYNEHLQYVFTWFGMSIALLVVYYFRFFHDDKKAKKGTKKSKKK